MRSLKLTHFTVVLGITCFISVLLVYYINNFERSRNIVPYRSNIFTHQLCLIVPFRDRFEELLEFIPHINYFLNNQNIIHYIFVINQVDRYRFNRGSLINVGFIYIVNSSLLCDYIAIHDVDLLPKNNLLSYSYPVNGSYHISAPHLHPLYHYSTFIGGILLMKRNDFDRVNGMSNRYWGWGLEDDEFYLRLKESNIFIDRPGNLSTGIHDTFHHIHTKKRKRDMVKCYNQRLATRRRDRQTGLNTVQYILEAAYSLAVNNVTFFLANVQLICDQLSTPWCLCNQKYDNTKNAK